MTQYNQPQKALKLDYPEVGKGKCNGTSTTTAKPKTTTTKPKTTTAKPKTTTAKPKTTTAKPKTTTEDYNGGDHDGDYDDWWWWILI